MGTTLRNVLVLLVLGLLVSKGITSLTGFAPEPDGERILTVAEDQPAAAAEPEEYGGEQELVLYAGPNGHFMVEAWVALHLLEFQSIFEIFL